MFYTKNSPKMHIIENVIYVTLLHKTKRKQMINNDSLNVLKKIWSKYNAIKITLKNGANYTFFTKQTEKWQIDRYVIINTVKETNSGKGSAILLRSFAEKFMRTFSNIENIIASIEPTNTSIVTDNILHIDVCFKDFEETYTKNRVPFDPIYDLIINTDEIVEFKPIDYDSLDPSFASELVKLFEEEHKYLASLLRKLVNIEKEVYEYKSKRKIAYLAS